MARTNEEKIMQIRQSMNNLTWLRSVFRLVRMLSTRSYFRNTISYANMYELKCGFFHVCEFPAFHITHFITPKKIERERGRVGDYLVRTH